ncbi:MAG: amino acid ABC transporter substrate-binding protein [Burkholderiales bacterium]
MTRVLVLAFSALFLSASVQAQPVDGRLKRILDAKTVHVAYRADASPFSFTQGKEVVGFSIDICQFVVKSIERQYKAQGLAIKWVPVTTQTRFDAVAKGQADMECSSSTATLSRMKQVDFSSFIFVESTGLVVKTASGIKSIADLVGKKIGVVAGTTNERAVNVQAKRYGLNGSVVSFKTRDEGMAAVVAGQVDAFASDKLLLIGAAAKAKDAGASLTMLNDDLSIEPYAIVLPRGDATLRLAVNTALAELYRSGQIVDIFKRWFADFGPPTPLLQAVYIFGAIPE